MNNVNELSKINLEYLDKCLNDQLKTALTVHTSIFIGIGVIASFSITNFEKPHLYVLLPFAFCLCGFGQVFAKTSSDITNILLLAICDPKAMAITEGASLCNRIRAGQIIGLTNFAHKVYLLMLYAGIVISWLKNPLLTAGLLFIALVFIRKYNYIFSNDLLERSKQGIPTSPNTDKA